MPVKVGKKKTVSKKKAPAPKPTPQRSAPVAPSSAAAQPTPIGQALRTIGTGVGAYFGAPSLGNMAGGFVSRLLGQGDYEVKSNSLLSPGSSSLNSAAVVMGPDGRRGVRIQEREFICVVKGSQDFTNVSYVINPANKNTFPWLSTIAQNFDEWRPNGIAFSFKSTSAAFNGSNQALGVVIGATDYDPTDRPYQSRLEMESAAYCVSNVASEDWVHLIECDPEERGRAVMKTISGSIPANASIMDFVLGNFQIATDGQSTNGTVLGELWVSYDITFYKKQLYGGQVGSGINALYFDQPNTTSYQFDLYPLGNTNYLTRAGNMNHVFLSSEKIQLPDLQTGCYRLLYRVSSSTPFDAGSGLVTVIDSANCENLQLVSTVPNTYAGVKAYFMNPSNYAGVASGLNSMQITQWFIVTGPRPVLALKGSEALTGFTPSTSGVCQLAIEQIPPYESLNYSVLQ